jgi:leader peptidase (prepilin peptidase) / N-methyltransferase
LIDLLFSGLVTLIVFVFGAAIGSFLNVVIYRLPAGLSILYPPSRCPQCLNPLKQYDNVPVLGWLWLGGRCRFCKNPISARYPLVEAATGILFVLTFWTFGLSILTIGYWTFFSWLLALALIDLDTMTLPNALTRSGLLCGLTFQAAIGYVHTPTLSGMAGQLMTGIFGAVLGIWLFDAITLLGSIAFGQAAMGGGDAKLAAMMGAWLGWKLLLLSSFLACALGALVGVGGMALGLISRRQPMPFGPFLALSALLTAFFGEAMISTYVRLFFPTL